MDEKKKTGYGFSLILSQRKAVNSIKESEAAQDLLSMLQLSPKGSELLERYSYEITLDRNFILHIQQTNIQHTA